MDADTVFITDADEVSVEVNPDGPWLLPIDHVGGPRNHAYGSQNDVRL